MKSRALMPAVATAALIAGAACLWLDFSRPEGPPNPLVARKAELRKDLANLQIARAKLVAQIQERERLDEERERQDKEYVRILKLPPLFRALEPGSNLEAPFIGIVSRDVTGALSHCEALQGRIPTDYSGYIDPLVDKGSGSILIGRLKEAGEMTYSFRICHEVTPEGRVLGIDPASPLTLDELRERLRR